jgi:hypothetical protein
MASFGINSEDFKTNKFDKQFLKTFLIGGTILGFAYIIYNNYIWFLNM